LGKGYRVRIRKSEHPTTNMHRQKDKGLKEEVRPLGRGSPGLNSFRARRRGGWPHHNMQFLGGREKGKKPSTAPRSVLRGEGPHHLGGEEKSSLSKEKRVRDPDERQICGLRKAQSCREKIRKRGGSSYLLRNLGRGTGEYKSKWI